MLCYYGNRWRCLCKAVTSEAALGLKSRQANQLTMTNQIPRGPPGICIHIQSLSRQWCGRYSGEPNALHDRSSHMDQDTEKLERHMQQTDKVQAWAMPHTNKRWASRSVTSAWASTVPGVLHQPSEHKTWLLLYFHFPKSEKIFLVTNLNLGEDREGNCGKGHFSLTNFRVHTC